MGMPPHTVLFARIGTVDIINGVIKRVDLR
jgi:hypothetical protein